MFASFIAPFGGFFASGFKRGFKIKDFGDSIPGHGGVTDRFDCQVGTAGWQCGVGRFGKRSAAGTGLTLTKGARVGNPSCTAPLCGRLGGCAQADLAHPTQSPATHAPCTASVLPCCCAAPQIVMAVFSWIYYTNYVTKSAASVAAVMSAVLKLGPQQQVGGRVGGSGRGGGEV